MENRKLTYKQAEYIANRVRGLGVAESYRRAYDCSRMGDLTVTARSSELENTPHIKERIQAAKTEAIKAAEIEMTDVIKEWLSIAMADPSELIRIVRDACRHCWGFDHRYQWRDEDEWAAACAEAVTKGKPAPDLAGGYGFWRTRGPHPECPKCEGEGIAREQIADLRTVSPGARKLFAGVERTKSGLKIHTRSQDDALRNIAKALGGLVDRVQLQGGVGVASIDSKALTDAQREQVAKLIQGLL